MTSNPDPIEPNTTFDPTRVTLTIAEWCHAAWCNSKNHGWHDDPEDGMPSRKPIRIALLHSEVSELLEAFRKDPTAPSDKPGLALSCAAEELADIVIRLFDYIVEFGIDAEHMFTRTTFASAKRQAVLYTDDPAMTFPEEICYMHRTIARLDVQQYDSCARLFMQAVRFAVHHNFDLELAVQVKHAYNVTRAHRHGGKQF